MKLSYQGFKDEDEFVLTDLSCSPSQELLNNQGLYKIIWNKGNATNISVDDYTLSLKAHEVLFCTPLNKVEVPIDNDSILTFIFNKQFFCIQSHDDQVSCNGLLFYGSAQPQRIKLTEKEVNHFQIMQQQIEEDFQFKDHLQGEMLRSSLKRLLIMSTRMINSNLPDPTITKAQVDIIRQFNLLVEKHFRKYHKVKDYANLLFKSPKTLSNLFLMYNDKSPLMMINERIMLEAKRLLLYSDMSSTEIAIELGYKDGGHFSKFFKKHTSMTPILFRKSKL